MQKSRVLKQTIFKNQRVENYHLKKWHENKLSCKMKINHVKKKKLHEEKLKYMHYMWKMHGKKTCELSKNHI